MNKKNLIILLVVLVILIVSFGTLFWKRQKVEIITDSRIYENSEKMKLKIKNLSLKNICFSSCYPYYLEKKNGQWQSYHYESCPKTDLSEKCLKRFEVKAFEISLPESQQGLYRILVPACLDCQEGEVFQEAEKFYSNEFTIK